MNSGNYKGTAIAMAVVSMCTMGVAAVGHAAETSKADKEHSTNKCKGSCAAPKTAEHKCNAPHSCAAKPTPKK